MKRPVSSLERLLDDRSEMFLRMIESRCPEFSGRPEAVYGEVTRILESIDATIRAENPLVAHLAVMALCRAMEVELGNLYVEQHSQPTPGGPSEGVQAVVMPLSPPQALLASQAAAMRSHDEWFAANGLTPQGDRMDLTHWLMAAHGWEYRKASKLAEFCVRQVGSEGT